MDTPIFDTALDAADVAVAVTVRELLDTGAITYEAPADTESEGAYLVGVA